MKIIKYILIILFYSPLLLLSQEGKFGIDISGFVKTDIMFDSRQSVSVREGHFLLYPSNKSLDVNGDDINANPNMNILSIQSRLTGKIKAPDAFGGKVGGVFEGAFFGHSNGDINGFRLRHAFVKINWEKYSLIVGQYWHPLFITQVFPGVISFNTGVPFTPFSRNPQVRLTYKPSELSFSLTASTQRDFASTGPQGTSSNYLRNSFLPMMNLNIQYTSANIVLGIGLDYKSLMPQLETDFNYSTDERINSLSYLIYGKYYNNNFTWKVAGFHGENSYDLLTIGGYAVKSYDNVTGVETYTNIKTLSFWTDISYGTNLTLGLFGGYSKNSGSDDNIVGSYYSRGNNIKDIFRLSPRVAFKQGQLKFAAEIEYTEAAYGNPDINGEVRDADKVSNIRFLLSSTIYF